MEKAFNENNEFGINVIFDDNKFVIGYCVPSGQTINARFYKGLSFRTTKHILVRNTEHEFLHWIGLNEKETNFVLYALGWSSGI